MKVPKPKFTWTRPYHGTYGLKPGSKVNIVHFEKLIVPNRTVDSTFKSQ